MTLEELAGRYIGRIVDGEKIGERFAYMGKFGRVTAYSFAFETENALVRTEVCVQESRIIGIAPEKEPMEDDWGIVDETYQETLTDEEIARMGLYLRSVLAEEF